MVMDNCHKLIMKVETDNWRVEEQEEEGEDGEVKVRKHRLKVELSSSLRR